MIESNIRAWIQQAFQEAGFYYYHSPDTKTFEVHSRPDVFVMSPAGCIVIEVKRCPIKLFKIGTKKDTWDGIFSFKEIRDNQRHLLDSLYTAMIPTYLGIGPTGGRFKYRSIFLIPWGYWLAWEYEHIDSKSVYFSTICDRWAGYQLLYDLEAKKYTLDESHPARQSLGMGINPGHFQFLPEPLSRRFETIKEVA
jgi:hypothetical protein